MCTVQHTRIQHGLGEFMRECKRQPSHTFPHTGPRVAVLQQQRGAAAVVQRVEHADVLPIVALHGGALLGVLPAPQQQRPRQTARGQADLPHKGARGTPEINTWKVLKKNW